MKINTLIAFALAISLWTFDSPAVAGPYKFGRSKANCLPEIEQTIQAKGVTEQQVQSIELVSTNTEGMGGKVVFGKTAWVRPTSGEGHLIVVVSSSCAVWDVYTRGAYGMDGVPSY